MCPRQDSNLRSRLRRAVLYPLSYGGGKPGESSNDGPLLAGRQFAGGGNGVPPSWRSSCSICTISLVCVDDHPACEGADVGLRGVLFGVLRHRQAALVVMDHQLQEKDVQRRARARSPAGSSAPAWPCRASGRRRRRAHGPPSRTLAYSSRPSTVPRRQASPSSHRPASPARSRCRRRAPSAPRWWCCRARNRPSSRPGCGGWTCRARSRHRPTTR